MDLLPDPRDQPRYAELELLVADEVRDGARQSIEDRAANVTMEEPVWGWSRVRFERPAESVLSPEQFTLSVRDGVRSENQRFGAGGSATRNLIVGCPKLQGGSSDARPQVAPPPDTLAPLGSGAGRGVKVVVMDTEPMENEVLAAHVHPPPTAAPPGGPDALPLYTGHANFVLGLLLGVAPGADVEVRRVLDDEGATNDHDLAKAIDELPDDVRVLSLSLGGLADPDEPAVTLEAVIAHRAPRMVIVAAAGNNGDERPVYPAAFDGVISVGAARYAAGGWAPAEWSTHGDWVSVFAPGEWVPSTFLTRSGDPDYAGWASWSGTSFATPLIAGHVAARLGATGLAASRAMRDVIVREAAGRALEPAYGFRWPSGLHGEAVPP